LGALASPMGTLQEKNPPGVGKYKNFEMPHIFRSPHISPGSPLGEADDKCIKIYNTCSIEIINVRSIESYWQDNLYSIQNVQLETRWFNYHRFRWYATLENKTLAETFPKFPSILRVIDRSDRNPPITARLHDVKKVRRSH